MQSTKCGNKAGLFVFAIILFFMLVSTMNSSFALEKLDTPTNLRWDGKTARWNPVPNAAGYSITIELVADNYVSSYAQYTKNDYYDATHEMNFLANQTGLLEGIVTFRFCVTATTNDYDHYVGSDQSEYSPLLEYVISSKTKLDTPTNLRWDGKTARWNPVPNAAGYSITIELVADNYVSSYAQYTKNDYYDATHEMNFLANQTGLLEGIVTFRFCVTATTNDYDHYVGSDRSEYSSLQPCVVGYKEFGLSVIWDVLDIKTLPNQLETIAPDAFANTAFEAIIIPEGCSSVGEHAFAWCNDLLYVRIPKSVVDLASNAFEGSGKVYIDFEQ